MYAVRDMVEMKVETITITPKNIVDLDSILAFGKVMPYCGNAYFRGEEIHELLEPFCPDALRSSENISGTDGMGTIDECLRTLEIRVDKLIEENRFLLYNLTEDFLHAFFPGGYAHFKAENRAYYVNHCKEGELTFVSTALKQRESLVRKYGLAGHLKWVERLRERIAKGEYLQIKVDAESGSIIREIKDGVRFLIVGRRWEDIDVAVKPYFRDNFDVISRRDYRNYPKSNGYSAEHLHFLYKIPESPRPIIIEAQLVAEAEFANNLIGRSAGVAVYHNTNSDVERSIMQKIETCLGRPLDRSKLE